MKDQLRAAGVILMLLTVVTGCAYPLLVTGLAQLFFPWQANGSLILSGGRVRGSALIGQPFDGSRYFWSRPSATAGGAYSAFDPSALTGSSGSNYGPLNPALQQVVQARAAALRVADPGTGGPIPVDLVTASASGLDPHISVAAALYQVPRVARARNLDEHSVHSLISRYTEPRQLGILGEPRVNVLKLNLALDGEQ